MKSKQDLLGFLGLLYVGDKALIGEELLEHLSKVALLIVANDAESGQSESLKRRAQSAHIPMSELFSKEELGQALGHASVTFVGITDKKAAGAYLKKLTEGSIKK